MTNLDEVIQGMHSIGIAGHVRPDGDCVGSCLGVYNYIRTYYPDIDVRIYLEPIPNIFKFMNDSSQIRSEYTDEMIFDLFIALDCGDAGRLGEANKYFESARHTVCIDHHLSNQSFAEQNYIFPEASSTSELVFELINPEKITKKIAECLYTGIVHDTGVFQYSCTSAKTMNIAGILMDKGIDYSRIIDETFYAKTFEQNQVLGYALLNSRLYLDGKVIASCVTDEVMHRYHVLPKHLDGIVSQLRVTKGVEVAIFLYQTGDNSFKVSTRASGDVNLAEIAMKFGGGGHAKAAGFSMEGDPEQIIGLINEEIKKQL